MKLLVNFIKVKQKPDEDALVQLLKLLYYQDQIPGRARTKLAKLVSYFSISNKQLNLSLVAID